MCGISGFIQAKFDEQSARAVINAMTDSIAFRGPDDSGYWLHPETALVFGHRRLAVQDLSAAGHQPMHSASQRFTIIFNGEIYNHLELRHLLEQESELLKQKKIWQGHSDTESLLSGFECWGIEATIKKSKGMFAFAVFDAEENTLTLGRDRLGEKPLYYGWQGESFIFASTLSPFKKHPDFLNTIDRNALKLYFRYSNVPGESCIFEGIKKLPAGSLLTLSLSNQDDKKNIVKKYSIKKYWSLVEVITKAKQTPFTGDEQELVNTLDKHLRDSIKNQMLSDVPLGAFLSGGIDSSTVVSLMQAQSKFPIHTFSIGFEVNDLDEAHYAKAVAAHLGTHHTELYVSADDALKVIPELPLIYDEPFSDSSQIPVYLLAKLTRENVVVALSGDGGDELFAGYNRYTATSKLWFTLKLIPLPFRSALAKILLSVPESFWNRFFSATSLFKNWSQLPYKIQKAASVLDSKDIDTLYLNLVSHWHNPDELVIFDIKIAKTDFSEKICDELSENLSKELSKEWKTELSDVEIMMLKDTAGYLIDDILVKVDRAAMYNSLETRIPMLDHELIEFAWSLPMLLKINKGRSKWPLRAVLARYVPMHLIDRPKAGFAVPMDQWLRGPLKNWAEDLLNEARIKEQGFLNSEPIQKKWQEHLSGKRNWASQLWSVLMFQAWLELQGNVR